VAIERSRLIDHSALASTLRDSMRRAGRSGHPSERTSLNSLAFDPEKRTTLQLSVTGWLLYLEVAGLSPESPIEKLPGN
jgi:hypothetical protein